MKRVSITSLVLCVLMLTFATLWGAAAEKSTITVWWQGLGDADAAQSIIDTFNESHPWVQAELVMEGGLSAGPGLDKVKTAIAAGTPPDVVYLGMHILPELYMGGFIIPIDEVLPEEFLSSIDYLPAPRQLTTLGNRTLGVQFRTDARGMYYNTTHFNESGLDPSVGPDDIEELDQYAERLTRWGSDGSIDRLGFAPRGNNFLSELGWLWVFGGSPYDFERNQPTLTGNPAHVRAIEWIASYAQKYGADAGPTPALFQSQDASMRLDSTSRINLLNTQAPDVQWGVSHIPYPPEGIRTTNSSGPGPVIPYGAPNVEASAELIKYMASKEVQMEWYRMTQQPPARADAMFELIANGEITDPREIAMLELMPNGFGVPPLFIGVIRPLFVPLMDQVRRSEITPLQLLENVQRESEPAYRELFDR